MTLGLLAESTIRMAFAGRSSTSERSITIAQVAQWLSETRDMYMEREIEKAGDDWEPDDAYFTDHGEVAVTWNDKLRMPTVDIPGGLPPSIAFNKGIRVYPALGGGMMIPVTPNYFEINPQFFYFEGNIAWEIRGGKLIFPNIGTTELTAVTMSSIVTKVSGLDSEIPMPSRHAASCRDLVVKQILMVMGYIDNKQDGLQNGGK